MSRTNKNLRAQAYNTIKDRIINCIYEPGSIINEVQLAADLGISRTPIREAINLLESEGLLSIIPKKGIYVCDVTLADVQQIFQTRLEVEPIALRMAIPHLIDEDLHYFRQQFIHNDIDIHNAFRLDTAMHLYFIEHSGNRYISNMMSRVFEDNTRVIIYSKQNHAQIHDAASEHVAIIDALLDKDTEKAVALMKSHIKECRNAAIDYISTSMTVEDSVIYKKYLSQIQ